jgi:predicted nucleotidyltransferase component of viral defense system
MIRDNYKRQVALLLDIMPSIGKEKVFALHGGTAINLFEMDMPRLSVDVDLTFIPFTNDREYDIVCIRQGISRIKANISTHFKNIKFLDENRANEELKLICAKDDVFVKIEVNQINRGIINETRMLRLSQKAQEYFDTYCQIQVVSFGQLWGGKMNAALDRQHPRDLFDMQNFYQHYTITDEIKRGFLFFLLCSKRPIHEVLQPKYIDQRNVLINQFVGMSDTPFSCEDYENIRQKHITFINNSLADIDRDFILSFAKGEAKWNENYNFEKHPPIKWKLLNINKLKESNPDKFLQQIEILEQTLKNSNTDTKKHNS